MGTNGVPVIITLNVSDGAVTTSITFNVTITAQNDTPTVSAIADQIIVEDTDTGLLTFTVGDFEIPAGSLLVAAASSNQTLSLPLMQYMTRLCPRVCLMASTKR